VGYFNFVYGVVGANKTGEAFNIFFSIFYLILCIGLVVAHYLLEPAMTKWIIYASFPDEKHEDGIDSEC